MDIVVFAFNGNISSKVINKLNLNNKHIIASNKNEIDDFVNEITKNNPDYVLGLGMYSRSDKNKLRIETHCSDAKSKIPINYYLTPGKHSKLANGIGNSYCNYVSLNIMKAIKNKKLDSKYTFIHIPKTFQVSKAVSEIEEMLNVLVK